ncbi:hypothetical protein [Mesorhizobium sp. M4A.F.Ca.ET.020.02.1.1]|uniref:hypothetical protein n=3 Tax=unclassified Mesorhizobium TaxID=325217 RepID=UPI0016734DC6|nr:hypothetical protein [Mesorhizobium sp. M4A.F.Ca.ET.020.02.1.1]
MHDAAQEWTRQFPLGGPEHRSQQRPSPTQSRNKIQQSGKTREKTGWHNPFPKQPSAATTRSSKKEMPILKKSLLSVLGLAVALAFAVPALGTTEASAAATTAAATTTTAAPAAATATAKPAAKVAHHKKHKKHHKHHARKHHLKKHRKHHVKKHHVKKHVAKKAA